MKLGMVALDYDGTIAERGVLHPAVRAAIASAREREVLVVIVSGRILAELRQVAGDLRFVDAVVAENGAVLAIPAIDYVQALGPPPAPAFLAELNRAGVPIKYGQVIVEADTEHASTILRVIQEQQLPLTLLFNRDRVMVLPQALNKSTGLRELLRMVRRSEHDAVGIGDAENDHALLTTCEIGAAVGWGSDALKAVADEIVEGDGPEATARYIEQLARRPNLDPVRTRGRRTVLGTDDHGEPLTLASGAQNLLIAGDPAPSWAGGVVAEQLVLQRYCVCVIDPAGDYAALRALPGVTVLGGGRGGGDLSPPSLPDVVRALRYPDASVVIDLSGMSGEAKRGQVRLLLATLKTLRRRTGLPHRIVLDAAHEFLDAPSSDALLDLGMCGYTLVTTHLSEIHPDILAACETVLATRTTDHRELRALIGRYRGAAGDRSWLGRLAGLTLEEVLQLPEPRVFRLRPRLSR